GELVVLSGGTNIAAGATVTALDSIEAPPAWGTKYLVDQISVLAPTAGGSNAWVSTLLRKQQSQSELQQLNDQHKLVLASLIDDKTRSRLERCRSRLEAIKSELAALPPPQLVYAASRDFAPEGSFKPDQPVRPVYLLARGDVKRPKELISPAAPAV